MKKSADLGGCYPPRPSASVDNTLLDLQNFSYPTRPHSIIAKYSIESSHTPSYIPSLLARSQGAFQSQFYITQLKATYMTMIKNVKVKKKVSDINYSLFILEILFVASAGRPRINSCCVPALMKNTCWE